MTIKQLLENGIEIEGKVTVRQYDYKSDIYKVEEDGESWLIIEVE